MKTKGQERRQRSRHKRQEKQQQKKKKEDNSNKEKHAKLFNSNSGSGEAPPLLASPTAAERFKARTPAALTLSKTLFVQEVRLVLPHTLWVKRRAFQKRFLVKTLYFMHTAFSFLKHDQCESMSFVLFKKKKKTVIKCHLDK